MFETAELGRKISKKDYREQVPVLRERLLEAQGELRDAGFPVIILFAGVDGAGKGGLANLLNEWMDPHRIVARAFDEPSDEESDRPEFWRYWRSLPPSGHIGVFLSAWYSQPLLKRVYGEWSPAEFEDRLARINAFEKTLVDDGAVILKYWMHLGRTAQKRRLRTLEKDSIRKWRVSKKDWKHWRMYDDFVATAERILMRTGTGEAPWKIVEGEDECYRNITVGSHVLAEVERALARPKNGPLQTATAPASPVAAVAAPDSGGEPAPPVITVLSQLDMTLRLTKSAYARRLEKLQARLNQLYRQARAKRLATVLVFEGWDAAGKGGAIRRVTRALNARGYEVIAIGAPTDEEKAHHYLWRFWRRLPRAGRVTVFDRSWYGRVLVERVEGFASRDEWGRAYAEINDFEQQLVDDRIVLVKCWIHITNDEQRARFESRLQTPYKRWKITDEDWRNRDSWQAYETAVNEMVEHTSTTIAPWILVEGNDKRYARIKVLEAVCNGLEEALGRASKSEDGT